MAVVTICSDLQFSSVQLLSRPWIFATPWIIAHQASMSITNSQSLLKLLSIKSVMPSSHLILCRPVLLLSIFPSIRVFSNESALHIRCPKYWSFSFSISPSNKYSGLISFRMGWLDLLAVPGALKSPSPTPQFKSADSLALSRQSSGWESMLPGFDPWSGMIPQAREQLSPCTATAEPILLDPVLHKGSHRKEKPKHQNWRIGPAWCN